MVLQGAQALESTPGGARHAAEDHQAQEYKEWQSRPRLEIGGAIPGGCENADRLERCMAETVCEPGAVLMDGHEEY